MKILVTGSTGLIGRNLKLYVGDNNVPGEWIFTSSKDADLRDFGETERLFQKYNPTYVINLAAYVGGLYKNMRENTNFFRYNMLINMNVMECSLKYKILKLISISSTCIFPNIISYPITEKDLHNGPPHPSNIGYSYSKRMIDVLSTCYNMDYKTMFITVIIGNIYGPHDNFNIEDGHVIPSLIHKCYLAKKNNTDFIISGEGKALRQFTYVEDIVSLLIWSLNNYTDHSFPIILCNEEEISIKILVEMISDVFNYKGTIIYDDNKSEGQYKKTVSNNRLKELYPNFKFISLTDGIKRTVHWFNNNYTKIRH